MTIWIIVNLIIGFFIAAISYHITNTKWENKITDSKYVQCRGKNYKISYAGKTKSQILKENKER